MCIVENNERSLEDISTWRETREAPTTKMKEEINIYICVGNIFAKGIIYLLKYTCISISKPKTCIPEYPKSDGVRVVT